MAAPSGYENAKTSVWWNIDDMPISKGSCKPEEVAQKITSALRKKNYNGQISIFAYGNMDFIPPSIKKALSSTGVHLENVHYSFERGHESELYSDSIIWTGDHPPPANLMFISRDKKFRHEVEWKEGYNILVAHPPNPSHSLVAKATTTWIWKSLLEEPVDITSQTLTRPILGSFSSHLKIGIVGLPNVGKSTLFNTLTKLSIPAENFPFCTIEPNEARVNIPDERFDWLCQTYKPKSEVPAFLEIHDIAGLVRGAHEGQGLGNNFLSHIRAVDGIFHVLRAFEDDDIIHVDDIVDPVRDLETITEELRLKDIEFVGRKIDDVEKSMKRSNDKQLKIELELLQKVKAWLEEGKDVRFGDWKAADIEILNTFQLLSAKPVVYLINMNERNYQLKQNLFMPRIHAWVQEHGGDTMIPFSGLFERTLADMPPDEAAKYCEENKLQSALPRIIETGFSAINLISFFTAGPDEVKCWQIRQLSKAPQAAGAIHTDFERGFICAEVMKFEDLKELGNEPAVKAAGKYRQEGKTYIVQDGDIIFFKFNVSGGGKK